MLFASHTGLSSHLPVKDDTARKLPPEANATLDSQPPHHWETDLCTRSLPRCGILG